MAKANTQKYNDNLELYENAGFAASVKDSDPEIAIEVSLDLISKMVTNPKYTLKPILGSIENDARSRGFEKSTLGAAVLGKEGYANIWNDAFESSKMTELADYTGLKLPGDYNKAFGNYADLTLKEIEKKLKDDSAKRQLKQTSGLLSEVEIAKLKSLLSISQVQQKYRFDVELRPKAVKKFSKKALEQIVQQFA